MKVPRNLYGLVINGMSRYVFLFSEQWGPFHPQRKLSISSLDPGYRSNPGMSPQRAYVSARVLRQCCAKYMLQACFQTWQIGSMRWTQPISSGSNIPKVIVMFHLFWPQILSQYPLIVPWWCWRCHHDPVFFLRYAMAIPGSHRPHHGALLSGNNASLTHINSMRQIFHLWDSHAHLCFPRWFFTSPPFHCHWPIAWTWYWRSIHLHESSP